MAEGERIAKRIAAAGVCSRRDAERLIGEGRVAVNGTVIHSPALNVTTEDEITVDGEAIKSKTTDTPKLYVLHKPPGYLTTSRDPEGRPTVFDLLPPNMPRVVTVGRLDYDSEGLLLLTTSGTLARAMELPKNKLPRTYRVRVHGEPSHEKIDKVKRGVTVDGVQYRGIDVKVERQQSSGRNFWLNVTLKEGKNREIRRIFEHIGSPVSRLIRISYAGIELGDLRKGEVMPIAQHKVAALCKKLGVH